jgi:hypothetical protein
MSKGSIYNPIIIIFSEKSSIFFKKKEIRREKSRTMITVIKVKPNNKLGGLNRK